MNWDDASQSVVVTWFKTHKITSDHINYSIAYPKPQDERVLLGYCSHFASLKPSKNPISCLEIGAGIIVTPCHTVLPMQLLYCECSLRGRAVCLRWGPVVWVC